MNQVKYGIVRRRENLGIRECASIGIARLVGIHLSNILTTKAIQVLLVQRVGQRRNILEPMKMRYGLNYN
jgi:hypothetical protein